MHSLLDFIARYYHWLLFLLLEGISFVLLFQFNHYHNSVWFTTANTVVGQINAWEQEVIRFVHLDEANRDLTERNLLLEQQNTILREHILEQNHDSTLVERLLQETTKEMTTIPGKVITNSVLKRDNYMTIDVGEADGVQPEMGVVSGTGIVGIVYMTSTHYSIVMPLLNSKSRISCRLHGTGYSGYLKWEGDDPLYAVLDDIPLHARFDVGDMVETSGFSSVFPAGLFVGKVSAIENSDDGLSKKLIVHLGTDFGRLQNITVIASTFHDELQELEQRADSLAQQ